MNRYKILAVLIALFICSDAYADSKWFDERTPNARLKAMGGAGVAMTDNLSSLYINPATMVYSECSRLNAFYGNLLDSSHSGYMGYTYPFSLWGALGAGVETGYKDNSNFLQNYSCGLAMIVFEGVTIGSTIKTLIRNYEGNKCNDFGVDTGIHVFPYKRLAVGVKVENVLVPELNNEGLDENPTRNIQAGISFFDGRYFRLAADLFIKDMQGEQGDSGRYGKFGIEFFPDPALALRIGSAKHLRLGVGIQSKYINFNYAIDNQKDSLVHFFEYVFKLGIPLDRKEKELIRKSQDIKRETLYFEGLVSLRMGEVAIAKEKVAEYKEKFGIDEKIKGMEANIEQWLSKVREEKMGRIKELKKEILKCYYQEKIEEAFMKLKNLRIIAPYYEETKYLEHLLNARVYLEEGDYRIAEQELIEALKINPESKEVKDLHKRIQEVIKLSE
ncbi:hypothetical protein ACFLUV_02000 [Elusimicrobiota bacterium]